MEQSSAQDSTKSQDLKILDGLSVEDFVKQPRFNRSVKFLSSAASKEITASYAIAGSQAADARTFLYVGGIIGGRLHGLFADYTLARASVRGIFVDRPGLGFFTATGIQHRIPVWYEAIPLILKDVGVDQVAIVSLSGGAPYAFNLFFQRPDLIDPKAPLFVLSPWIHPSKSGVRMHSLMSWVPASLTRGLTTIAAAAVQRLVSLAYADEKHKRKLSWIGDESRVLETCGAEAFEVQRHRAHFVQTIFNEDTSGSAEDYILGVKDPKDTWGLCADYATFAKMISERNKAQGRTLRIHAFFAAHDFFIGDRGIKYFIDTFGDPGLSPGIDFTGEVLEDTDHEGVALPENGAIQKMIDLALHSDADPEGR